MKLLSFLLYFCVASVQATTLQDPTKPSSNSSAHNTDTLISMALKLTAIIDNSENKQAIINGQSFIEGQQVQGYKVVTISQNHVLLDGADGKQTLYVNNNNIKKDANNGF